MNRAHRNRMLAEAIALAGLLALPGNASEVYKASGSELSERQPYIFVQQHNGKPGQKIRKGWPIQVQLPGNPAIWTFDAKQSRNVVPLGKTLVYSPDRIDGMESLFIFDLALELDAEAGQMGEIVYTTDDPLPSLNRVIPNRVFRVQFEIIADKKPVSQSRTDR
ncbi:hypothetical protein GCM10023115_18170 [Pontixanthobacter gangjinensis]|uniref:Uncharacterized protein n=1 Tax=Pontixanthobacter gangjinensis TaxID=1028742 RepID=A0A6I4SMR1_9SPHN|nr:hypothetical protein [Pontixanthobacter gangjinensis]MXO57065.1 hypothetical protein [Pontixanthobacter gangjinensis]